jgi:hypothetical protein
LRSEKERAVGTVLGFTFMVIVSFVFMSLFYALLFAFPVMLLWNWLLPHLLGLPEIDFWQAAGLVLLTSILFKSSSYQSDERRG